MKISQFPGTYERHFFRQYNHYDLFPKADLSTDNLNTCILKDKQEAEKFQDEIIKLVQQAIDLEKQTESQILLDMSSDLEKAYTYAISLAGDQKQNLSALSKLIDVFTKTVNGQVGEDTLAIEEMAMQIDARALHFKMLKNPLIADLLRENNPVSKNKLLVTIIAEEPESCLQCLSLFDDEQIIELLEKGITLQKQLAPKHLWKDLYQQNIENMGGILKETLNESH